MNPRTCIPFMDFSAIFLAGKYILLGTRHGIVFLIIYEEKNELYRIADIINVDGEVVGIEASAIKSRTEESEDYRIEASAIKSRIEESEDYRIEDSRKSRVQDSEYSLNNIFVYMNSGKIYLMSIYNQKLYTKKTTFQNLRIIRAVHSLLLLSNRNVVIHDNNLDIFKKFISGVYNTCIVKADSEAKIPIGFNLKIKTYCNLGFQHISSFFVLSSSKILFFKITDSQIAFYERMLIFKNKSFFCGVTKNNFLYIAGDDHSIRRLDFTTDKWISVIAHTAQIFCIVYYQDYIYSLSTDMCINIFTMDLVKINSILHNVNNPRFMNVTNDYIIIYGESIEKIPNIAILCDALQ